MFCCFVDSLALKSPYGERSIKYVCMYVCMYVTLVVNNKLAGIKFTSVQRTTFKHISVYTEQFSFNIHPSRQCSKNVCCLFVVLLAKDATVH